jgi:hypothetical protein
VHRVEAAARHQKIEQLHRGGSGMPKLQWRDVRGSTPRPQRQKIAACETDAGLLRHGGVERGQRLFVLVGIVGLIVGYRGIERPHRVIERGKLLRVGIA